MRINNLLILLAFTGMISACATTAPRELVSARQAYKQASNGPAAQVAPAELHVAGLALTKAERSFNQEPDSYKTKDLAYVAQRKAEIAEATASITIEKKNQSQSREDFVAVQGDIVDRTKDNLDKSQTALKDSERTAQTNADKLAAETLARVEAEKRAADAMAALAKLAAVKDEARGMVITLSGSVLFASDKSALLPGAEAKLDQVAAVLLTSKERFLVVEGHTDSQGSDSYNMDLSQHRSDAVRNFLIRRGYPSDRIQANGLGEGMPVADNGSSEGRANNRRVEIIIKPANQTSNL